MKSILMLVILLSIIYSVSATSLSNCNNTADCNFNGECYNNVCHCDTNYATLDPTAPCDYTRKSQWASFFLALFLGEFGAGFFYVGNITYGMLSWMPMFVLIPVCCMACFGALHMDFDGGCAACFGFLGIAVAFGMALFGLAWYIYQIVVMAQNSMNDSNGIALAPW